VRQWHVNCKHLCNKHLLGEHVEHHMFRSIIARGMSTEGYIADGLLVPGTLQSRHDQVAKEMLDRGMKHTSPFELLEADRYLPIDRVAKFDVEANYKELARRCPDCRERIEESCYREFVIGIPEGGDFYRATGYTYTVIQVYISGKLVGIAPTKAKAVQVMEKTRKKMRADGSIWK